MATAKITPNASTWTQVSDGTSLKTLQVTHGSLCICVIAPALQRVTTRISYIKEIWSF